MRLSVFLVTLSPLLCFLSSLFVSLSLSASLSPFSLCPSLLLSNSLSHFHCFLISLYLLYFIVYFSMFLHLHLSSYLVSSLYFNLLCSLLLCLHPFLPLSSTLYSFIQISFNIFLYVSSLHILLCMFLSLSFYLSFCIIIYFLLLPNYFLVSVSQILCLSLLRDPLSLLSIFLSLSSSLSLSLYSSVC
jgi:hypothetical protein